MTSCEVKTPICKTPTWEKVSTSGHIETVSIETNNILGLQYIFGIHIGRPEGIASTGIRGIRFALDSFGIRAIRLLFSDQSESPWLGPHRFSWYGEIHGNGLHRLQVIRDVCKLAHLPFAHLLLHMLGVPGHQSWL